MQFEQLARHVRIALLTKHVHQRHRPLPALGIADDLALKVLPLVHAPQRHIKASFHRSRKEFDVAFAFGWRSGLSKSALSSGAKRRTYVPDRCNAQVFRPAQDDELPFGWRSGLPKSALSSWAKRRTYVPDRCNAQVFRPARDDELPFGWRSGSPPTNICFWVAQRFTAAITSPLPTWL